MTTLADRLLPDALWQRIQPCCRPRLPGPRRRGDRLDDWIAKPTPPVRTSA